LAVAVVALVAGVVTWESSWDRAVFGLVGILVLSAAAARYPAAAAVATLLFLPFLGLARRLLIAETGWPSYDPLLLIGPVMTLVLLLRALFQHKDLLDDAVSKLAALLLLVTVVEVFNPSEPLSAGLLGLLFLGAPLLWLFVGRAYISEAAARATLLGVVLIAVAVAAYGLLQTYGGLPSWDAAWVNITGYAALHVGQQVRAFGTFASAAEYALFLGIAIVTSCAMARRYRVVVWLASVPLLAVALFVESSRGVLILVVFALVVAAALTTGRPWRALAVIAVASLLVAGAYRVFGTSATSIAASSSNSLVAHQLSGLADPFNPDQSTLPAHFGLLVQGVVSGFEHPLGAGTGSTSLASERAGVTAAGSEVDMSNTFVALGVVGGCLYVALVSIVLWRALRLALRTRDRTVIAVAAILVVSLGQWLNGGYYATAPLLWALVGWLTVRGRIGADSVLTPGKA
jgi:hypothetical protein